MKKRFNRIFVTGNILEYKKQKTGIGEQSCIYNCISPYNTGSSTIELPSAFAESGAYPPDRELPGSPRQCSLPLACRHPPEGHQIGARKRRTPENTILSQRYCRRVSTDRPNRESSQLAASLEGGPGPTPAGKTLPWKWDGRKSVKVMNGNGMGSEWADSGTGRE